MSVDEEAVGLAVVDMLGRAQWPTRHLDLHIADGPCVDVTLEGGIVIHMTLHLNGDGVPIGFTPQTVLVPGAAQFVPLRRSLRQRNVDFAAFGVIIQAAIQRLTQGG